jgi:hypothetical protein
VGPIEVEGDQHVVRLGVSLAEGLKPVAPFYELRGAAVEARRRVRMNKEDTRRRYAPIYPRELPMPSP